MHLKFGYFCIVHLNLSINCPCRTVGGKIAYVLGPLENRKVVVEFRRKVFRIDCRLWKTLNMAKISISEWALESVSLHTKTQSVTIQGNNNRGEVSKWSPSVGSSTSCLYQSRYDVGRELHIISHG